MSPITRLLSLVLAAGLSISASRLNVIGVRVPRQLGKSGSEMLGGVYRIGLPRTDLRAITESW